MLYREVPKNGDKLSTLGYGCMRFPGSTLSIDEKRTIRQIRMAIDGGVNYVDTAWPYHNGKSEVILGKALKDGYREKVKIADKLPHWMCASAAEMEDKLDIQLKRLDVEFIDYYLIHNLDGTSWTKCKEHGVIEFLEKAKKDKKIINTGFSFHGSTEDFNPIVDAYDWEFCQIQYNILDEFNQAGRSGLEYAASKNLAVIVMEPLRGGSLARKLPDAVKAVYDKSAVRRSNVQWALKWILDHKEVTCVLSGMNEEDHIKENLYIAETSPSGCLSEEERTIVKEAGETYRQIQKVPCTACQYCMPCPAKVNIPMVFSYYNGFHLFKERQNWIQYLAFLGGAMGRTGGLASQCTKCGACVKKCPQHIDIPAEMTKVESEFEGFFSRIILKLIRFFVPGKK
jgi:hypothetical protein